MLDRVASSAAALRDGQFADPAFGFGHAVELRPARVSALLAPLSGAFDLAESQAPGHSVSVAFIASAIAERLDLDAASRRRTFYAALLHDAGVAIGELPSDVDATGGHTAAGAWVASRFGLDEQIQEAIRLSHERWDGLGRPYGLTMTEVPVESLIVGASHWACDLAQDPESPLRARANAQRANMQEVELMSGARIAAALADVLRDDATWVALWDDDLPGIAAASTAGDGRASVKNVERIASAMGEMVDASVREHGRANKVAMLAAELARQVGVQERQRKAVATAAQLLDIGQLGVPRHIMEKPAILSVNEMEQVRRHPGLGSRIIEAVPGMYDISRWVEAHHERQDGRGYPEMLEDDQIPFPARILAVADSYWALRAERPYRAAFSPEEALEIIEASAGTQYDSELAALLPSALAACETRSRRAP